MRSTAAVVLGSVSILFGAVGMLFAWVPLLGFAAFPLGVVGGLLALIGMFAALLKGGGWGTPVAGGFICLATLLTPIIVTGVLIAATDDAIESGSDAPKESKKKPSQWVPGPAADNAAPEPEPQLPEPPDEPEFHPKDALTFLRIWTNKEGKKMQAYLTELYLVDGRYFGTFRKKDGETFRFKIGDLSQKDIDLVKEIESED
jgi:hypothetical protein